MKDLPSTSFYSIITPNCASCKTDRGSLITLMNYYSSQVESEIWSLKLDLRNIERTNADLRQQLDPQRELNLV